jgi:thioredoxin 1
MRTSAHRVAAAAVAMAVAGCAGGSVPAAGTGQAGAPSSPSVTRSAAAEPTTSSAPSTTGGYVDYATYRQEPSRYAAGPVVLFFHAPWCPDCQRTDANLTADPASLPAGLTVVRVDFDSMTELRQTYGVTRQWTFVSIDAGGARQRIWTGTDTGAEIAAQV